jgi:hypothetical protein
LSNLNKSKFVPFNENKILTENKAAFQNTNNVPENVVIGGKNVQKQYFTDGFDGKENSKMSSYF